VTPDSRDYPLGLSSWGGRSLDECEVCDEPATTTIWDHRAGGMWVPMCQEHADALA
jgi:hypothetical protein